MSECMISTPNLEGGANSTGVFTSWALITVSGNANATAYIDLPFQVSHLYFMNSNWPPRLPYDPNPNPNSNDLLTGEHHIAATTPSSIYAMVYYKKASNQIQYEPSLADMILYYIAIPA